MMAMTLPDNEGGGLSSGLLIGVIATGVIVCLLIVVLVWLLLRDDDDDDVGMSMSETSHPSQQHASYGSLVSTVWFGSENDRKTS